MNTLWISIYLISASVSPQMKKAEQVTIADKKQSVYKMLVAKPKDISMYACLKESKKDHSKYKILNAIIPEKEKATVKNKQQP